MMIDDDGNDIDNGIVDEEDDSEDEKTKNLKKDTENKNKVLQQNQIFLLFFSDICFPFPSTLSSSSSSIIMGRTLPIKTSHHPT